MRIRKNAKISPLLFTCSSSLLQNDSFPLSTFQTHLCQLNQSPWDVIPFPSNNSIQFEDEGTFKNGDSFGAVGGSVVSMVETDDGDDSKQVAINNFDTMVLHNNKKVVGGDKGLRQNSNGGNGIVAARRGRGRPRKLVSGSGSGSSLNSNNNNNNNNNHNNSNSNEFYYYSGFGPWWGKRRGDNSNNEGEDSKSGMALAAAATTTTSCENVKFNNNVGVDVNVVPSLDMDYVEDYEEDYDDYCDDNGKRRMRKPVKERSLKSLM